ncbi:hypothetical protein LTR56_020251 [Elasticomyces elasticus]|nr:hypothetical protein LTR56_020251 [Elasticomyces elasticus]KAK3633461.1 hypothetical protein LTR22_020137 [Elasticomyces elasticus]KAK4907444.1 hypothetical protein LTR49_023547 [Elasticomyces elasticus]KAK5747852.1 hypothetical protein LTS12_022109 [Elasticomyces elasticus]
MATSKRIHWHVPISMTVALLCAIALSLGHHFFYARLNGHLTPIGSYHVAGKSLSKQQFNTAVGTAFAFLVKSALTVATTLAYVQVFWWTVNNAKKGSTLAELDTLSALGNIVGLFNVTNRWRHPLLFGLALIFWCAPIATVITPATLSVSTGPYKTFSMVDVPQFDFANLDFTYAIRSYTEPSDGLEPGFWGPFYWESPSLSVYTIASAVLGQGQILPIPAPASNTSWTLDFWGPALQCKSVEGALRDTIWVDLWNTFGNQSNTWPFLAWAPTSESKGPPPEVLYIAANSTQPNYMEFGDPATLMVATLPNMLKFAVSGGESIRVLPNETSSGIQCEYFQVSTVQQLDDAMACDLDSSELRPSFAFEEASLLECNLVNTSYSADFTYTNGNQIIKVSKSLTEVSSPLTMLNTISLLENPSGDTNCPASLQQDNYPGGPDLYGAGSSWNYSLPCLVNATVLQQLSYQSIFSAFAGPILGVFNLFYDDDTNIAGDTGIMTTVLAQTEELHPIRAFGNSTTYRDFDQTDLQSVMRSSNGTGFRGLANDVPPASRGSLKAALEMAFENITISVLSDPYLQPNTSSQFAPSLSTNVMLETTVAFYAYDRTTLWIAYGLAILFSTSAVIVGLVFLVVSGASYDTTFSTIIRVAKAAHLNADLLGDEGAGYQPLPQRLAKARLMVGSASPPLLAQLEMHDRGPKRQKLNVESNSLLAASEEGSERNRQH